MNDTSRRRFVGVAGAGAAVAGAAVLVPGAAEAAQTRLSPGSAASSVVAHVHGPHSDKISLFVGEREVVVHDRDLVARLLNAAGA